MIKPIRTIAPLTSHQARGVLQWMAALGRVLGALGLFAAAVLAEEFLLKDNLIADGGFEQVRAFPVNTDPYIAERLQNGCDLTDGPIVVLPANFDQVSGILRKLRVVEGKPGREVHSGQRAVLVDGGFYIRPAVSVAPGDTFQVEFWAKGEGTARMAVSLYPSKGACVASLAARPASIRSSEWVRVEQTLEVGREHATAQRACFYIATTGAVYLDDLSVTRSATEAP